MNWQAFGDWGTSNLRLFRMVDGKVVDRRDGPGIGVLDGRPESALRETLAEWRRDGDPDDVRLCGMVGSRNGWVEAPYLACPTTTANWSAAALRLKLDEIPVSIACGLSCNPAEGEHDVMRGEETQIFGALELDPALRAGRHLLALPGTHSKWAHVEDGVITRFRTVFTGEMFALLRDQSTLLRAAKSEPNEAEEQQGYQDGLRRADRTPFLLGSLFEARAAQLLADRSASWAIGYISGLLIGSEVAGVLAAAPSVESVRIVGDVRLAERYERALIDSEVGAQSMDGELCALAGLKLLGSYL